MNFITFAKSTGLVSVTPSCIRDGKRNVLSFLFRSVDKSRETRSEPIWFTFWGSAWCNQTWCWLNSKQRRTAAKMFVYTLRSFSCHYEHTAASTPSRRKICKHKDSVNNDYPLGCFVFCDNNDRPYRQVHNLLFPSCKVNGIWAICRTLLNP